MWRLVIYLSFAALVYSQCLVPWQYYTQKVDHFNGSDTRTFQQAYLVSDFYWKSGGPIFFFVGYESTLSQYQICATAAYYPIGFNSNALVVAMEHRFYGQSLPFGNNSFTLQNMHYLTIDQAVADFATFLSDFRRANKSLLNSPIIVFGGSYAALLSTLLRSQYPDVVLGAVSSAAPIFLYTSNIPGDMYFETVSASYQKYYPLLATAIASSMTQLDRSIGVQNTTDIQHELNLCNPPSAIELAQLPFTLKNAFAHLMQFNDPNPGRYSVSWPATVLSNATTAENATWGTPLAEALRLEFNLPPGQCFTMPAASQSVLTRASSSPKRYDADTPLCTPNTNLTDTCVWQYQACTEFIQPQGGTGIFVFNSEWSYNGQQRWCQQVYPGTTFKPYPAPMGLYSSPQANFTNVIFANGLMDPIRTFSPSLNLTGITVLNIDYSAHCEDINLPPSSPNENPEPASIPAAREAETNEIAKWISQLMP